MSTWRNSMVLAYHAFMDTLLFRGVSSAANFALKTASVRSGEVTLDRSPVAWVMEVTDFMWVTPSLRVEVAEILMAALAYSCIEGEKCENEIENVVTDRYTDL